MMGLSRNGEEARMSRSVRIFMAEYGTGDLATVGGRPWFGA